MTTTIPLERVGADPHSLLSFVGNWSPLPEPQGAGPYQRAFGAWTAAADAIRGFERQAKPIRDDARASQFEKQRELQNRAVPFLAKIAELRSDLDKATLVVAEINSKLQAKLEAVPDPVVRGHVLEHYAGLSREERTRFLWRAIEAKDTVSLGAILSAPPALAYVDRLMANRILESQDPDSYRELADLWRGLDVAAEALAGAEGFILSESGGRAMGDDDPRKRFQRVSSNVTILSAG